jgi:diaminopimelate decarboxylase
MELVKDRYVISGMDVIRLVEKYGSPLYVYNTERMMAQYRKLSDAFSGIDLKINYACKALTNINILRFSTALDRD